eukprot:763001-Hanusia_phi.AAC.7
MAAHAGSASPRKTWQPGEGARDPIMLTAGLRETLGPSSELLLNLDAITFQSHAGPCNTRCHHHADAKQEDMKPLLVHLEAIRGRSNRGSKHQEQTRWISG